MSRRFLWASVLVAAGCDPSGPIDAQPTGETDGQEIGVVVQSRCAQQAVTAAGAEVGRTDIDGYASFVTHAPIGPLAVSVGAEAGCKLTCTLEVIEGGGLYAVAEGCDQPVLAFGQVPPATVAEARPKPRRTKPAVGQAKPSAGEPKVPAAEPVEGASPGDSYDEPDPKGTEATPPIEADANPTERPRAPRRRALEQARVTIACAPPGLRLLVDRKVVAAECSGTVDVELVYGVHHIELEAQAGQPRLPKTRKQIEVPTSGTVEIRARSELSCTESIRRKLDAKKKVGKSELECLRPPFSDAKEEREAKLLLAFGLERLKDYAGATKALETVASSDRGKFDPDIHLRLARLLMLRKAFGPCVKSADAAWTYRNKLRGKRAQKTEAMLEVLSVRAGCLEERFYESENTRFYNQAKQAYEKLEQLSTSAKSSQRVSYAQKRLAGMKQQAASLETP